MEILKKVCFRVIPIATLLIAVSYGMSIILGTQGVTYLQSNPNGLTTFDFKAYLTNLTSTNFIKPFENLASALNVLVQPINKIKYQFTNLNLENFFKGIANIGVLLIDLLIFIVDLLMAIMQCLLLIIGKLLNLIGINTSANIGLFNIFRQITNFTIINGFYIA